MSQILTIAGQAALLLALIVVGYHVALALMVGVLMFLRILTGGGGMSRSRNSRKGSKAGHGNDEWHSRRLPGWWDRGRFAKWLAHRKERRAKRRIEQHELAAVRRAKEGE